MKNFCKDPIEHATEIINFAIKEMLPLTKKEKKKYKTEKCCHICKKKKKKKKIYTFNEDEKHCRVRDHCITQRNTDVPHNVFHNGSECD